MAARPQAESTLTDRYQTTVPASVRRALQLQRRDRLAYTIRSNGEVVLSRGADAEVADPLVERFLSFLAGDMERHPERITAVDKAFLNRVRTLTRDVAVDLDAPLSPADE